MLQVLATNSSWAKNVTTLLQPRTDWQLVQYPTLTDSMQTSELYFILSYNEKSVQQKLRTSSKAWKRKCEAKAGLLVIQFYCQGTEEMIMRHLCWIVSWIQISPWWKLLLLGRSVLSDVKADWLFKDKWYDDGLFLFGFLSVLISPLSIPTSISDEFGKWIIIMKTSFFICRLLLCPHVILSACCRNRAWSIGRTWSYNPWRLQQCDDSAHFLLGMFGCVLSEGAT